MEGWEQRARNENDPKARSATLLSSYYTTKWFVSSYSGYFRSFPLLFFFLLSLNLLFCLFVNPEKRKWKLVEKVSLKEKNCACDGSKGWRRKNRKSFFLSLKPKPHFSCYGVNNLELKKAFIINILIHYYIAFIFLKKKKIKILVLQFSHHSWTVGSTPCGFVFLLQFPLFPRTINR